MLIVQSFIATRLPAIRYSYKETYSYGAGTEIAVFVAASLISFVGSMGVQMFTLFTWYAWR